MTANNALLKQRLVAILAADAVGYSRLMAGDDRATVHSLDAARQIFRTAIEANQGHVIDTAGDSVLAVFDIVLGAVSAALSIQQQLVKLNTDVSEERVMRFRIGIHLGDVVEKQDGTVYGDGVNIASRLEGLTEPGGVTVSDTVHSAVRGKTKASFVDLGEQQVKNIPDPVRAYALQADGVPVSAACVATASQHKVLTLPDKPSIAVLPFANMSEDSEQAHFADGMTEDIITELSRFHSLFVIARNSVFTYKGRAVDVRTVAQELGVRYVLEGSIRRAGNRVRVTGQLVDAQTAHHLWAEKYDRVLEDIFAVQEDVTRAIVAAIAPHIDTSEVTRSHGARPGNLTAYALAMRAWAAAQVSFAEADREERDKAIQLARDALDLDPTCSIALRTLAWSQWQHIYFNTATSAQQAADEGIRSARRAIALDFGDHVAHLWKGLLLFLSGQEDAGLADVRRAHELNPNDAMTLCYLGYFEAFSGHPQRGIDYLLDSLRLSPRDPSRYLFLNCLGWAHFAAGDYGAGAQWAEQSIEAAPKMPAPHLCLILHLVGKGNYASAKTQLALVREFAPELITTRLNGNWNFSNTVLRKRASTFLSVACGLTPEETAQAVT